MQPSLRPLFACIVWDRWNTLTYACKINIIYYLASMMCSLEQPLSLSCIVILNVNQSEVTFLWREWSHQPYADIYSNFIWIIVWITVNNLVVWNFYSLLYFVFKPLLHFFSTTNGQTNTHFIYSVSLQIYTGKNMQILFEIMYGTYSDSATPYNFLNKALYSYHINKLGHIHLSSFIT